MKIKLHIDIFNIYSGEYYTFFLYCKFNFSLKTHNIFSKMTILEENTSHATFTQTLERGTEK